MRKALRLWLALALLAAPAAAQTRAAGAQAAAAGDAASAAGSLTAAPALTAPSLAPAGLSAAPLSAPAALAAPSAASSVAAPAAAAPAAAVARPAALAAPIAAPAALPAAAAAPADGPKSAARSGASAAAATPAAPSADEAADSGRAFFDQAADERPIGDIVRANVSRPLASGVFIQQEHEGNLLAADRRDSSGDVFRYYRPVEFRPELMAQSQETVTGFSKLVYSVRKAFQVTGRNAPDAAWRAWSLSTKLDYLDRLEKAVVAERGKEGAWDGKVSLLMERKEQAPNYLTKNPHMEAPPDARKDAVGAKFIQPEIVTDKDHPAASVSEALGRAKVIIGDTAHAGVQFHVFIKAAPKDLLAQMDSLDGALQTVNDVLYAKAAYGSDQNISHPSLLPWHSGRTERVRELLAKADPKAHVPAAEDPDSEKHAFVGFRYWGMEDGKAVVSLELRGASLPWKKARNERMARGIEETPKIERDYSEAQAYLTYLSLYAEAVAKGRAPRVQARSVALDEAAADAYLRRRAEALGAPAEAFDGIGALARRLIGAKRTPAGYLFPFAASPADSGELRAFADQVVLVAARMKAAEEAGTAPDTAQHARYLFWSAYQEWAASFGARRSAALADLVRASSR